MRGKRNAIRVAVLVAVFAVLNGCGPPQFAVSGLGEGGEGGQGGGSSGGGGFLGGVRDFFRQSGGGTAAATSANYKLKGVGIAAVGSHEAASPSFKKRDATTGQVKQSQ